MPNDGTYAITGSGLGPLGQIPAAIEVEGLPQGLPLPQGQSQLASGLFYSSGGTPTGGSNSTQAEVNCYCNVSVIIRIFTRADYNPRIRSSRFPLYKTEVTGHGERVYLFKNKVRHTWKGPGSTTVVIAPPPDYTIELLKGPVIKKRTSLWAVESMTPGKMAETVELGCNAGEIIRTFDYRIHAVDELDKPEHGGYEVTLQVNWNGAPPPFRVSSIQGTPNEVTSREFYPNNAKRAHSHPGEKAAGGTKTSGTLLYTAQASNLARGVYVVRFGLSIEGQFIDPVKSGFDLVSGPLDYPEPGLLQVKVLVEPPATTRTRITLKYKAPKGGGGGGGMPPEVPKKKTDPLPQLPGKPPSRSSGGPFVAGPSDYSMGPAVQYEYVDQYIDESVNAQELSQVDSGYSDYEGGHYEDESGSSVYPASAVSGLTSHSGLSASLPYSLATNRSVDASSPPWTQLQILLDPNGSIDARDAIRLHAIDGEHAVRAHFNGRRKNFISGPEL
jgi:hypothetical protein